MNILVVCQYYKPEPFRISDICEALVERGHRVTVVTGTPNYPEGDIYPGYEKGARARETINGVRVLRCPLIPRKSGALYRFLNYYSFVFSARHCLHGLKEDFDVVFVNQLSPVMMAQPALSWARRKGKQCILYCLDLWPESLLMGGIRRGSLIYKVFECISNQIYRKADAVLVSSLGLKPYISAISGLKCKSVRWLPQYAEALFDELPERAEDKHTMDFLFAGNVGSVQSVETIVEAARLLREQTHIRIHIVGSGSALDACKALAEGLPNITFHGRKDVQEMPGYYAMADAMLISLVPDAFISANLPGKVQSYMAAGKAVIGSIDGETARVIQEADCGVCAPAGDAEALADVLCRAAANPEDLRRWGENARSYYRQHFRKEGFLSTLESVLQEHCG